MIVNYRLNTRLLSSDKGCIRYDSQVNRIGNYINAMLVLLSVNMSTFADKYNKMKNTFTIAFAVLFCFNFTMAQHQNVMISNSNATGGAFHLCQS